MEPLGQPSHTRNLILRRGGKTIPTAGGTVDKTIAQLNIAHFRDKLKTETDETTRQTLLRLLAEEEAKLAALNAAPKHKPIA